MSGLRARVMICASVISSLAVMSLAMRPAQATPSRGEVANGLHPQIDAARAFNGTFFTALSSGGPSPHCGPSGWLIDVTGTLQRVGRPDWNLTASACVNASPILALGSFTITTGSGTILTGTARAVIALPTSSTLTLIVQRASREYTGGTLVITSELATSVAKVTGALTVAMPRRSGAVTPRTDRTNASKVRVVTGGFGINGVATPPDPRCTGGTGAVLTGTLNRTGLTPWPFTVTGCLGLGPAPTFTMTTGRGVVIQGDAGVTFFGTLLTITFDVRSASSEYVGGHIMMSGDTEIPGVKMTATGQLIVG